jgi:protein-L-isoaspartate(D-aspartate) O-methyltransferase
MTDYAAARLNMIESQVRPNGITDSRIIAAMEKVAREDFVPDSRKNIAYADTDVQLAAAQGPRYLIEAMAFAKLVQLAQVKPGDRVLCVGAASGYGCSVLAQLGAHVVALESDAALVAELRRTAGPAIDVAEGPLEAGVKARGPYDVILVEGRVAEVPAALLDQLAEGGRLVAVVGETEMAKACVYSRGQHGIAMRQAFDASVAPLPGFAKKKPAFVF